MVDITLAHARLLKDAVLQVRFLDAEAPVPPAIEPAGAWWLLKIGETLFWPLVAVIATGIVVILIQVIRHRVPGLPRGGVALPDQAVLPAIIPASALADADALAEAGRYGAAVHALLLRGVGVIQDRFPRALTRAHTSRDIAALGVLPPALRTVFSTIAGHAERAVFARVPLGREEWEACRALYAGLLGPAPDVPS